MAVLKLAGSRFEQVSRDSRYRVMRAAGSFAVDGAQITFAADCPAAVMAESGQYTFEGSDLILHLPSNLGGVRRLIFRRC